MPDKHCECRGLKLMQDMFNAYIVWNGWYAESGQPQPMHKKPMRLAVLGLHQHLKEQSEKLENSLLVTNEVKKRLQRQEKEINEMKWTDGGEISTLDNIRDDIHKVDEVKQLMVCGGPLRNEGDLTESAKMIKIVTSIMGDQENMRSIKDTAEECREALVDFANEMTCTKL